MTSGRDKGIAFERKICVELSKWWSQGITGKIDDSIFWRSNASGARATVRAKKGKKTAGQYGDITAIDPVGEPFLAMSPVECKRGYPKVSVHDMLDQQKGRKQVPEFEQWIQQAQQAAKDSPTAVGWLLITSRYQKQTLVWMPKKFRDSLVYYGAGLEEARPVFEITGEHGRIIRRTIIGMPLSEFLYRALPQHYINLHRKRTGRN